MVLGSVARQNQNEESETEQQQQQPDNTSTPRRNSSGQLGDFHNFEEATDNECPSQSTLQVRPFKENVHSRSQSCPEVSSSRSPVLDKTIQTEPEEKENENTQPSVPRKRKKRKKGANKTNTRIRTSPEPQNLNQTMKPILNQLSMMAKTTHRRHSLDRS